MQKSESEVVPRGPSVESPHCTSTPTATVLDDSGQEPADEESDYGDRGPAPLKPFVPDLRSSASPLTEALVNLGYDWTAIPATPARGCRHSVRRRTSSRSGRPRRGDRPGHRERLRRRLVDDAPRTPTTCRRCSSRITRTTTVDEGEKIRSTARITMSSTSMSSCRFAERHPTGTTRTPPDEATIDPADAATARRQAREGRAREAARRDGERLREQAAKAQARGHTPGGEG